MVLWETNLPFAVILKIKVFKTGLVTFFLSFFFYRTLSSSLTILSEIQIALSLFYISWESCEKWKVNDEKENILYSTSHWYLQAKSCEFWISCKSEYVCHNEPTQAEILVTVFKPVVDVFIWKSIWPKTIWPKNNLA